MGYHQDRKDKQIALAAKHAETIERGRKECELLLARAIASSGLKREDVRKLLSDQATAILGQRGLRRRRRRSGPKVKIGSVIKIGTGPRPGGTRYVYVIGCPGHPIKIGPSSRPLQRLKELQTGSAMPLRIYLRVKMPGSLAPSAERECHRRLDRFRLSGEWFDLSPEAAIEAVKDVIGDLAPSPA